MNQEADEASKSESLSQVTDDFEIKKQQASESKS